MIECFTSLSNAACDWAEPLSWLAAIAGFVVAAVALVAAALAAKYSYDQLAIVQDDHKRLAAELSRRPNLVIGFIQEFMDGSGPDGLVGLAPSTMDRDVHAVCFKLKNTGQRTARDITVKVRGPRELAKNIKVNGPPVDSEVLDDLDGKHRWLNATVTPLNPNSAASLWAVLHLVADTADPLEFVAMVGMADEPDTVQTLRAHLPSRPKEA